MLITKHNSKKLKNKIVTMKLSVGIVLLLSSEDVSASTAIRTLSRNIMRAGSVASRNFGTRVESTRAAALSARGLGLTEPLGQSKQRFLSSGSASRGFHTGFFVTPDYGRHAGTQPVNPQAAETSEPNAQKVNKLKRLKGHVFTTIDLDFEMAPENFDRSYEHDWKVHAYEDHHWGKDWSPEVYDFHEAMDEYKRLKVLTETGGPIAEDTFEREFGTQDHEKILAEQREVVQDARQKMLGALIVRDYQTWICNCRVLVEKAKQTSEMMKEIENDEASDASSTANKPQMNTFRDLSRRSAPARTYVQPKSDHRSETDRLAVHAADSPSGDKRRTMSNIVKRYELAVSHYDKFEASLNTLHLTNSFHQLLYAQHMNNFESYKQALTSMWVMTHYMQEYKIADEMQDEYIVKRYKDDSSEEYQQFQTALELFTGEGPNKSGNHITLDLVNLRSAKRLWLSQRLQNDTDAVLRIFGLEL